MTSLLEDTGLVETTGRVETRDAPPPETAARHRPATVFLPLLLLALAVIASLALQVTFLATEREQLGTAASELAVQEQAATQVRASLDALATATARLAAAGNANARGIVEQLGRRGVTIQPNGAATPP